LKTLKEMGDELWRLIFVNNGLKLTIEGSEVLPILKELAESGVHRLVCGTCLTHFNLQHKKQMGETINILEIVTSVQAGALFDSMEDVAAKYGLDLERLLTDLETAILAD